MQSRNKSRSRPTETYIGANIIVCCAGAFEAAAVYPIWCCALLAIFTLGLIDFHTCKAVEWATNALFAIILVGIVAEVVMDWSDCNATIVEWPQVGRKANVFNAFEVGASVVRTMLFLTPIWPLVGTGDATNCHVNFALSAQAASDQTVDVHAEITIWQGVPILVLTFCVFSEKKKEKDHQRQKFRKILLKCISQNQAQQK